MSAIFFKTFSSCVPVFLSEASPDVDTPIRVAAVASSVTRLFLIALLIAVAILGPFIVCTSSIYFTRIR